MAVTGAFLRLGNLCLDLPQPRHCPVDGRRGDQVEVVHADQVKQEVSPQVSVCNVRTTVLHKQHDGLVHLVICYKPEQEAEEVTRYFSGLRIFFFFWCILQKLYPCFMTWRFQSFITSFSPSLTSVNSSICCKSQNVGLLKNDTFCDKKIY